MTLCHHLLKIASAAALAVAAFVPTGARAQGFDFLWGGSEEFGGGRQVISFSPQYKPGQIIVSFSDRRLYLITKPGQAITYPVAVPTGEAHWHVLLRARAIETGCHVVAAAQGGDHADGRATYGHSLIVDPWGKPLAEIADMAGGAPYGIAFAPIAAAASAQARQAIPLARSRAARAVTL